jgi:hypothetical protein
MARQSQLPNDKDVERRTKRHRNLAGDRNASARQPEDHDVAAGELAEVAGQHGTRLAAIRVASARAPPVRRPHDCPFVQSQYLASRSACVWRTT